MGARIFVTGATGFIGANLVRRLVTEGHQVHAVIRPDSDLWRLRDLLDRITLHWVDLLDSGGLRHVARAVQPEVIFHLAMTGGHPRGALDRIRAVQVGVIGTLALLEAALETGAVRFVHVGSSLEYGRVARAMRESDPLRPVTDKGLAKSLASQLVKFYARKHGVSAVIVRPFSVYGPWESPQRFIPTLLRAAITGEEIRLTPPGYRHDFIFVDDVVEGCLRAASARTRPGEAFNLGTGVQWTNEEVVTLAEEVSGRKIRVIPGAYPPGPADARCWVADIRKACRRLGWLPEWSLAAGLGRTLDWLRSYLNDQAECGPGSYVRP
nr:dTDP-glucose 4,6-dehydratase 2 [uncultured bacterium]